MPHAYANDNGTCTLLVPVCVSRYLACPQHTWLAAGDNGCAHHSAGANEEGRYRLSWHTGGESSGWRAGQAYENGGITDEWKKLLYWIEF